MRLLFAALALFCFNVHAQTDEAPPIETSKTFGDYVVHYNAFPSTTLLPAVAAEYNIERGKDIAFINIAVRNKSGGGDNAQPALVKGTFTDLVRKQPIEFREIREQNAIYYIAQVRYNNREVLRFDVQIQPQLKADEPAPIGSPFNISFTRKFYIDP